MNLNNQSTDMEMDEDDRFTLRRDRMITQLTDRIREWVKRELTPQFTASDTKFASIEFSVQSGDGYMVFPTISVEESKAEDL